MTVGTDFAVEFYSNKHIKHDILRLWGLWGGGGGGERGTQRGQEGERLCDFDGGF